MSNKLKVFLLGFLLVCTGGFCGNLHVFYEQNGDCFVLVGNGNYRGVYALNNLTTDKYNYMYDPKDAYGITAGQWWTGTSNETSPSLIEKRLYTFWASGESSRSLDGVEVKRRVIPIGTDNVYDNSEQDPPFIVHRRHSGTRSSPTGLGNHTHTDYMKSLDRFFTPSDIPCTEVPVSAGTDSAGNELYLVTSGVDWFHDRTRPVWSNYTYPRGGGWCHRVAKEFLTEYTKDISLMSMDVNNKQSPKEVASESAFVATVTTGTEGTASTLGECVDGCITAQPAVALPPEPEPIVRFVYSSQVKKSYLYNRPLGETSYTLNKCPGDTVIGEGDDVTCNFIGVSSKSNDSNYVYLLGSKVINNWLTEANVGVSIAKPEDLACVAVSDQWWQTGGIVYAYDSQKGKVYSFVRVEGGKSGNPTEIDVQFDGRKPDKIGADGFGNLYVLKTELDPPNTNDFGKDGTESEKKYDYSFEGQNRYLAIYRQNVYKTVYKRPYGRGTKFTKINQRVPIGVNEYEKGYITEDNDINSKKIWISKLQQTRFDGDGSSIRTELAVINVPTPPEPVNVDAVADCCGPMELDSEKRLVMAEPDNEDGSFSSTRNIIFMVENPPSYDGNGVNTNGSTEDKDKDGAVGCFPNTIKESSVVYHWRIVRTKDRFGKTINPGDPDYLVLDTTGNYLLVFPSLLQGEFDVGVKVEYRYYDYTQLKVGALASDKETCLTPKADESPKVAAARGRIVRDGYSWEHIKQVWRKKPPSKDGYGIIMSSLNYDDDSGYKPVMSSNDSKLTKTEFVMDGASLCREVDDNGNLLPFSRANNWGLKLRETKTNKDKGLDRIDIITGVNPPDPNDPDIVPGSLEWVGDYTVTWKAELKRNASDTVWSYEVSTKNFNLTIEDLRKLMPMPSDPLRYEIHAEVSREYMYLVYIDNIIQDEENGWKYTERITTPVVVTISIEADAEICVTDNTGPSLYQYNAEENAETRIVPGYKMVYAIGPAYKTIKQTSDIKNINKTDTFNYLYASTGETIDFCNPTRWMIFYVCDNNPMANYDQSTVVTTNTKDGYHLTSTNYLRASFNKNARRAILHYDTATGIQQVSSLLNEDIKPKIVTDEAELMKVGLVPSKALSYVKYEIPAGCMDHFSDIPGINNARLPFDYANNTKGYKNYKFGISWVESCDTSNTIDLTQDYNNLNNKNKVVSPEGRDYFVGNIVIKDNDRPNIFIRGFQDRYPDDADLFMVPTLVASSTWFENNEPKKNNNQWFLTVDNDSNGDNDWFDKTFEEGQNVDIKNCFSFKNPKQALITIFRKEADTDYRLLTDVPVSFKYVMMDNAGTPNCTSFALYNYETSEKLTKDDEEVIQYVFRKTGRYYVELQVEDDAKAWPDNSKAIDNPSDAEYEKQTRTLRAYFEVIPSKLEYRVLERNINKDY